MPFKIESKQKELFYKNGYIEFESLFSEKDVEKLCFNLDQSLIKQLPSPLMTTEASQLYTAGRDLWRSSSALRKYILMRSLAQIASDLTTKPVIRIAYDQLIRTTVTTSGSSFLQKGSLSSISCLTPLAGSFLIRLLDGPSEHPWIPSLRGGGVFLSASHEFDWQSLVTVSHQSFLLITYTDNKAIYIHQPLDLNTHTLKRLGYGFGDLVSLEHHPILFSHITRNL